MNFLEFISEAIEGFKDFIDETRPSMYKSTIEQLDEIHFFDIYKKDENDKED